MFPSSVFEHVVVCLDDFTTDVSCIPFFGVSTKVTIANNVDFSCESLNFNSTSRSDGTLSKKPYPN
jgi:hypothetical protein